MRRIRVLRMLGQSQSVGWQHKDLRRAQHVVCQHNFFNPNDFARAPFGTFGNARRDVVHGPGRNNTDFSIFKNIRMTEGTRFELRMEVFNLFNHTQFKNPSGNINGSTFGRVTSAFDPRQVQLAAKLYF